MSQDTTPTVVIGEAAFSTNFKLYAPDGTQLQFTCRAGQTHAEHLAELEAYRATLIAQGYANELPGLEENEKIEEVAAYVRGATKAGQPLVWLYSAKEVLKWRLTTVYEERLAELPFPIAGNVWPGAAAPEREEAAAKGYLQAIQPTKIVLESTEADENGKRKWKFARLYATPAGAAPAATAPAAPAPANGNGHPATAPADATLACPKCGGPMWDNRTSKKNPAAPDFKCKTAGCDGVIWPPKASGNGNGASKAAAPAKTPSAVPF